MSVDLARMCFAATTAVIPFGLHRKSLSSTTAIALKVLIGGADLAALNKDYLTGRTKEWRVDESAIFHLVTTVFIIYSPRLKPNTRTRMLNILTIGDMLHALSRSDIFATQAKSEEMSFQEAAGILSLDAASTHKDVRDSYTAALKQAFEDRASRPAISRYAKAYRRITGIMTLRYESLTDHFSNDDGTDLFEYPDSHIECLDDPGASSLNQLEIRCLAIRYWEKQSALTPQSEEFETLANHYVWITGQKPPKTDPRTTPPPLPKGDEAWEWLGCRKGAKHEMLVKRYMSYQRHFTKALSKPDISALLKVKTQQQLQRTEAAYCFLFNITITRMEAFTTYFQKEDGSPLFDYPTNGQFNVEQRRALAIRYWELFSTANFGNPKKLYHHYIWITGVMPPKTDPCTKMELDHRYVWITKNLPPKTDPRTT